MRIAVIGTRSPSRNQKEVVRSVINYIVNWGYELNTGGAIGVDLIAIEEFLYRGGKGKVNIYLPWNNYNKDLIENYENDVNKVVYELEDEWMNSVRRYHPKFDVLGEGARRLHARNYGIVINSDLVVAFPSAKRGMGGTGQGIRVAKGEGLPVLIYGVDGEENRFVENVKEKIKKLKN